MEERQGVLGLLREPRFVDLAPAEIYATLLDEGTYQCSIRTMYRKQPSPIRDIGRFIVVDRFRCRSRLTARAS